MCEARENISRTISHLVAQEYTLLRSNQSQAVDSEVTNDASFSLPLSLPFPFSSANFHLPSHPRIGTHNDASAKERKSMDEKDCGRISFALSSPLKKVVIVLESTVMRLNPMSFTPAVITTGLNPTLKRRNYIFF